MHWLSALGHNPFCLPSSSLFPAPKFFRLGYCSPFRETCVFLSGQVIRYRMVWQPVSPGLSCLSDSLAKGILLFKFQETIHFGFAACGVTRSTGALKIRLGFPCSNDLLSCSFGQEKEILCLCYDFSIPEPGQNCKSDTVLTAACHEHLPEL